MSNASQKRGSAEGNAHHLAKHLAVRHVARCGGELPGQARQDRRLPFAVGPAAQIHAHAGLRGNEATRQREQQPRQRLLRPRAHGRRTTTCGLGLPRGRTAKLPCEGAGRVERGSPTWSPTLPPTKRAASSAAAPAVRARATPCAPACAASGARRCRSSWCKPAVREASAAPFNRPISSQGAALPGAARGD